MNSTIDFGVDIEEASVRDDEYLRKLFNEVVISSSRDSEDYKGNKLVALFSTVRELLLRDVLAEEEIVSLVPETPRAFIQLLTEISKSSLLRLGAEIHVVYYLLSQIVETSELAFQKNIELLKSKLLTKNNSPVSRETIKATNNPFESSDEEIDTQLTGELGPWLTMIKNHSSKVVFSEQ